MAFLPNQQDPNQQQQGQQQGQIPQVPLIPTLQGTSGPSASQSSGTGVTNTATPGGAPSSPWQNVSSYLAANSGQAGSVADVLAGNLTSQYNTANQGIQGAQQNFGQQIESARIPYNQQVADAAKASPSGFAQDPNNVAAFQKMYNATYGGPQDFSHTQNYSDLAGQVQKAQGQAALVNQGTPGLMTLLQQAETQGGKTPTQGVTALDSLLLQENPSNFGKINAAAQPFAGLTDYLASTQKGLDTSAQQAAQEAAATQQNLQNQYVGPGGVIPSFTDRLNTSLQGAQKQSQDYNSMISNIISELGGGQRLSPTEEFNLDPSGYYGASYGALQMANQYPGIQPGMLAQYYQQPPQMAQTPSLSNVANPQDFADAAALAQLTGQPNPLGGYQPGPAYKTPTGYGSFQGQDALNAILGQLTSDQSYLPYMNDTQIANYPTIYNYIQGLATGSNTPPPVGEPLPPLPFPLQPPGVTSGGTQPGGGRAFY